MIASGIYYESHGPADAPPLILSAGLGGSGNYWLPNLPALAEHYRVILYDHRGTGRSDRALPAQVTVDDLADDLLAVMDGAGVYHASIMGHAAGALAGLALALAAPERIDKLIAVNGWAKADPHFRRSFATRLALLRNSGPEAYLHAQPIFLFPAPWISANSARLDTEEQMHLAHFPGAETMEKRIAALTAFDIDARLGRIDVPVLALAAKDDMLVPWTCSERLVAGIPGAALAVMAEGGHACNITEPAVFERLVLDFLSKE